MKKIIGLLLFLALAGCSPIAYDVGFQDGVYAERSGYYGYHYNPAHPPVHPVHYPNHYNAYPKAAAVPARYVYYPAY